MNPQRLLPQPRSAPAPDPVYEPPDDRLVHLVCDRCEISLCGLDFSEEPATSPGDDELECVVCTGLAQIAASSDCPLCDAP